MSETFGTTEEQKRWTLVDTIGAWVKLAGVEYKRQAIQQDDGDLIEAMGIDMSGEISNNLDEVFTAEEKRIIIVASIYGIIFNLW